MLLSTTTGVVSEQVDAGVALVEVAPREEPPARSAVWFVAAVAVLIAVAAIAVRLLRR